MCLALDPQLGPRLNLADCRERQGRLTEAYTLYEYSVVDAEQTNKQGRLTFAREQIERLARLLVRIKLQVTDEPPGLTLVLTTGARELPRPVWSRTIIAEPGPLTIRASAPDRTPVTLEHEGAAGAALNVEIPRLETTVAAVAPPPPRSARRSRVPFIIGGAGILLLGGGIVLAVSASSIYDGASSAPDEDAERDRAQRRAVIATTIGIAGAVGIGIGIALYVRDRRASRVAVVPTADGATTGVAIVVGF